MGRKLFAFVSSWGTQMHQSESSNQEASLQPLHRNEQLKDQVEGRSSKEKVKKYAPNYSNRKSLRASRKQPLVMARLKLSSPMMMNTQGKSAKLTPTFKMEKRWW